MKAQKPVNEVGLTFKLVTQADYQLTVDLDFSCLHSNDFDEFSSMSDISDVKGRFNFTFTTLKHQAKQLPSDFYAFAERPLLISAFDNKSKMI